jgi:hypothetical protein
MAIGTYSTILTPLDFSILWFKFQSFHAVFILILFYITESTVEVVEIIEWPAGGIKLANGMVCRSEER